MTGLMRQTVWKPCGFLMSRFLLLASKSSLFAILCLYPRMFVLSTGLLMLPLSEQFVFGQSEVPSPTAPSASAEVIRKAKILSTETLRKMGQTILGSSGLIAQDARGRQPDGSQNSVSSDISSSDSTWDSYQDGSKRDVEANDSMLGIRVEDVVAPPSQYRYAAFGKPDPFVPPMLASQNITKTEIPLVSILQRYRIGNLELVGMWEVTSGERKVLIMTPKEEGIIARVGDAIGKKGGKILSIDQDSIKIRQYILAPDGTRQFEDSEMYLGNEARDESVSEELDTLDQRSGSGVGQAPNGDLAGDGIGDSL